MLKNPNVRIGLWVGIVCLAIYIVYEVYQLVHYRRKMQEKPIVVRIQPTHVEPVHVPAVIQSAPTEIHIEAADIDYYKNDMMHEFEERSKLYKEPTYQKKQTRTANDTRTVVNEIANQFVRGSQTVHDTTVQSTIRNIYKTEVEATGKELHTLDQSVQRDIVNFMRQSDLPQDKYEKVETALLEIQKRNASIYNLDGETEGSLVARVWAGGNENVKRQLLNELVDSNKDYEGGGIYCPTGVVTRVLQATQIEHPEAMPRTRENLREEMMNTAARVRNELEQTDDFKALGDTAQSEALKSRLMETYHKEYDGIVDKDIIETETKEWIDAV